MVEIKHESGDGVPAILITGDRPAIHVGALLRARCVSARQAALFPSEWVEPDHTHTSSCRCRRSLFCARLRFDPHLINLIVTYEDDACVVRDTSVFFISELEAARARALVTAPPS